MVTVTMRSVIWLDAKGLLKAVERASVEPLSKAALLVESEAKTSMSIGGGKAKTPSAKGTPPHVQTGNLRASITTGRLLNGNWIVGPTRNAFYGKIHEFGGRFHPMRPFMRPALLKTRTRFPSFFKGARIRFKATRRRR